MQRTCMAIHRKIEYNKIKSLYVKPTLFCTIESQAKDGQRQLTEIKIANLSMVYMIDKRYCLKGNSFK